MPSKFDLNNLTYIEFLVSTTYYADFLGKNMFNFTIILQSTCYYLYFIYDTKNG